MVATVTARQSKIDFHTEFNFGMFAGFTPLFLYLSDVESTNFNADKIKYLIYLRETEHKYYWSSYDFGTKTKVPCEPYRVRFTDLLNFLIDSFIQGSKVLSNAHDLYVLGDKALAKTDSSYGSKTYNSFQDFSKKEIDTLKDCLEYEKANLATNEVNLEKRRSKYDTKQKAKINEMALKTKEILQRKQVSTESEKRHKEDYDDFGSWG